MQNTGPADAEHYKDRQRQQWDRVAAGWQKWWRTIEDGAQHVNDRLIELAGPTLTQKKITLQILNEISHQISSYLFLRTVISVIVAGLTALALWLAGLAQPVVWGFAAGVLNVVPYLGSLAAALAIGTAGFLQFHSLTMACVVGALTILIACAEAYVVTPLLTSQTAEINPVAVFLGLAFWGWLWGLPVLVIAVPFMMIVRAIGEHVEAARPLLALLKR